MVSPQELITASSLLPGMHTLLLLSLFFLHAVLVRMVFHLSRRLKTVATVLVDLIDQIKCAHPPVPLYPASLA
jgi:hypothetical protein